MAHRPAYPQQLYDMISEYHRSHGGAFESALDIGGGIGIVTREFLLKKFTHATLSDLSEMYISQAKTALAPIAKPKQLSFLISKIEDMRPTDLANGPVDLITAGECLHWADPLQVTPSAAQLIRPGGTFSAWSYGIQPVLPTSLPGAQEVWGKLIRRMMEVYELKVAELPPDGPSVNLNARFDNLHFDPQTWNNVRRIKVMPDVPMVETSSFTAVTRVLPEESQEVLDNDAFISRDVDYEWMVGFVQSLIPPLNVREELAAELKEFKAKVGNEVFQVRWPFALVLATRR